MYYLKQDILSILEFEIREIFRERLGEHAFGETINETKYIIAQVGEYLFNNSSSENAIKIVLGDYLYYLRYHFFNLWELYDKLEEQNSEIYQRFKQKEYDAIDLFNKTGFICMLMMNEEIQKAILIDKKYELYWYEFYQFLSQMELEFEKEKSEQIRKTISELIELKMAIIPTIAQLSRIKGIQKPKGRRSIVELENLLKFAELLEENRKEKKYTLKEIERIAAAGKTRTTAIRNCLKNWMPLLLEKRKSISELTKDDIIYMWKVSKNI